MSAPLAPSLHLAAAEATLDRLAREYLEADRAVGLSAAVTHGGRVVFARQYGVADRETGEPVTPESRFPIGSVSKQFTAAAILLLVEEGQLRLEDPVSRFFPDFTRAEEVSVRALLNHTSGYPDWYPLDTIDSKKLRPISLGAACREFGSMPLDFDPGAFYSYSNTGYMIAAGIVEKLTGRSFFEFLHERLLSPLDLNYTHDHAPSGTHFVKRYGRYLGGPIEPVPSEAPSWLTGAGGLISTPLDLAAWNIALLSGRPMRPESWEQMTAPTPFADGRISGYGLGLSNGARHGYRLLGHRGGVNGANAESVLIPELDVSLCWCHNLETSAIWGLIGAMIDALNPEEARRETVPLGFHATRSVEVDGPSPEQVVPELWNQIVSGTLDRGSLTPECDEFLAEERLAAHRPRLQAIGELLTVHVTSTGERGGMQVVELRLEFETGPHRALLGRLPDGTVAEFLFQD